MPSRAPIFRPQGSGVRQPRQRLADRRRGSAAKRGYDRRWRVASKAFLRKHPLCVMCEAEGKTVLATVVDYKVPHKGDMVLFWERTNWQGLCGEDHNRKTAKEDGGFGRG